MFKKASSIIFILLIAGCVTTQQLQNYEAQGVLNATGGMPGIVIDSDMETVRNVVIESMVGQGYTMLSESDHMVSFSQQMGGTGGFMYRALAGGAYSNTPECQAQVHIIKVAQGTKVMMAMGTTIQQGFGRVDKRDYTDRNTMVMDWLLHFRTEAEKKST